MRDGAYSLFGHTQNEADLFDTGLVLTQLYPDGRRVPEPYSPAELRRFGLVIDETMS